MGTERRVHPHPPGQLSQFLGRGKRQTGLRAGVVVGSGPGGGTKYSSVLGGTSVGSAEATT